VNLQDYIASGIIESYVMGLAGESERAEFEQLCAQYPELAAQRRKFEEKLEQYASDHAEMPPPEIKVRIFEAISNPAKIIAIEHSKSPRNVGWLRYIAAASVVLLIGIVVLYYQTSRQNKDLAGTNGRLKDKLDTMQSILDRIIKEDNVVKDPNTTVVNMVGTKVAPKSSANVYWDSTNTSVYLVVKNMPKLPSDQQYQLWALIDGKPKDLGVFDAPDDKVILKMKNTRKAQAFAITIEQKGGSPSPTLQKMQSLGKTLQTQ
jgi:anti-sigma-K factor RskA